MGIIELGDHSLLGLSAGAVDRARRDFTVLTDLISGLTPVPDLIYPEESPGRLFGTSGIRGVFQPDHDADPVDRFITQNALTPKLGYYFGRAAGDIVRNRNIKDPVWVVMDVRDSSFLLAMAVMQGLVDQGVNVLFGGVAVTTSYMLNSESFTIVITASHNPITYNGLKIFDGNHPLDTSLEKKLEHGICGYVTLEKNGKVTEKVDPEGQVTVFSTELNRRYFSFLQNMPMTGTLKVDYSHRLEKMFMPLDLAYGAAACPVDDTGWITRISPALAVILSLNIPVLGYGCTRDAARTNHRIGAAYAYGETPDTPLPGELSKFARGLHGYGTPAERIVFLPGGCSCRNEHLLSRLEILVEKGDLRRIPVAYPDFTSEITVIPLDDPGIDPELKTGIESEFMTREPLPGLMVDCDADRILITSPEISRTEAQFVSGDALIRFFAESWPNQFPDTPFSEVVFTVESGISLEFALNAMNRRLAGEGRTEFATRSLTVGDRAIIDYFLDIGQGYLLGGEPSGHIIFAEPDPYGIRIIDDPLITYLKMLESIAPERFNLDSVLRRMFRELPEYYCARKPDSLAGQGISIAEKSALELWENQRFGKISDYARAFIPWYIHLFFQTYARVFRCGTSEETVFSDPWRSLLDGSLNARYFGTEMPVARTTFAELDLVEELSVKLNIDQRTWAGPEVIHLTFYLTVDGETMVKAGEGVFRNSGTSPKNAGYHKLWPHHPTRNISLDESQLSEFLDELAVKRAAWTDEYVLTKLRSQ